MIVNNQTPTSALLEIKKGDDIEQGSIHGIVSKIEIQETDEFLQFIFELENAKHISIRKLKQVC